MKNIHHHLKRQIHRAWYAPLLGLLAAIDYFVVVIPTDGLLIASSMTAPRHWFRFGLWVSLGSTAGAVALAAVLQLYGTPLLDWLFPSIHEHRFWILSEQWMSHYGLGAIFLVAALPLFVHPIIAIAALMEIALPQIALMILLGRLVKYGAFSWLASHAPDLLFRVKGIKKEVDQAEKEYLDN